MQPSLPITIRKSLIGLLGIYVAGGVLIIALALLSIYLARSGQRPFAVLLVVVLAVTTLGTLVQAYVYELSRITLTADELDVVNWNSVVSQNNAVTEWDKVQDVDFKKGGILGQLFDYGTLLVQTAGTERNLRITYVPRVEYWRDYIAKMADEAKVPVST